MKDSLSRTLKTAAVCLLLLPLQTVLANTFYNFEPEGEREHIQYTITNYPDFPEKLARKGYSYGLAKVRVLVNERGHLDDFIVLEATDASLVGAIEEVILSWDFIAASIAGRPVSSAGDIALEFAAGKKSKVIIRESERDEEFMTVYSTSGERKRSDRRLRPLRYAEVHELDSSPRLLSFVRPVVSNDLYGEEGYLTIRMGYYIDADGSVRLPEAFGEQGDVPHEAVSALQDAMRSWRFTRLRSKGKPATMRFVQTIRIRKKD